MAEEETAEEDVEEEEERARDGDTHWGGAVEVTRVGGEATPPRGTRGPPEIPSRMCAPVIAERLWRLPASQGRFAPGRENSRQRCMEASLAPACCSVSDLVRHALWSGGAPLHGNLGRGMARGARTELELRETPRLRPRRSHKYVGRLPSPRDPGEDNQAHGPLREGPAWGPGRGCRGGRGCPRGKGYLRRQEGGQRRSAEFSRDRGLGEASAGRPLGNRQAGGRVSPPGRPMH